jgi:4-hydroxy-3-methylbut-2-enyl diphosphate reductase
VTPLLLMQLISGAWMLPQGAFFPIYLEELLHLTPLAIAIIVAAAQANGGYVVDAVCPLVTKVHHEVKVRAGKGYRIVYVGHEGHEEAIGTMAVAPGAIHRVESVPEVEALPRFDEPVALLAQTTQAPERLRELCRLCVERLCAGRPGPVELRVYDTICAATRERLSEARELAGAAELMLVVGDRDSANARRLVEICGVVQPRVRLVEGRDQVDAAWLRGLQRVAVTGAASTPSTLIEEVVARVRDLQRE